MIVGVRGDTRHKTRCDMGRGCAAQRLVVVDVCHGPLRQGPGPCRGRDTTSTMCDVGRKVVDAVGGRQILHLLLQHETVDQAIFLPSTQSYFVESS